MWAKRSRWKSQASSVFLKYKEERKRRKKYTHPGIYSQFKKLLVKNNCSIVWPKLTSELKLHGFLLRSQCLTYTIIAPPQKWWNYTVNLNCVNQLLNVLLGQCLYSELNALKSWSDYWLSASGLWWKTINKITQKSSLWPSVDQRVPFTDNNKQVSHLRPFTCTTGRKVDGSILTGSGNFNGVKWVFIFQYVAIGSLKCQELMRSFFKA